jgi:hypothetical protein
VGGPVKAVPADIFPTPFILEEKVCPGDFRQKDIEIVIVDLNPSHGMQGRFSIGGTLG